MYILSAVIENNKSKVALYDKEYKLLSAKEGSGTDVAKLCLDILSESKIKSSDVNYAGIAADGDNDAIIAETEKALGIKCYGASVISARALGEAYLANDVLDLCLLKVDDTVECGIVIDKKITLNPNGMYLVSSAPATFTVVAWLFNATTAARVNCGQTGISRCPVLKQFRHI